MAILGRSTPQATSSLCSLGLFLAGYIFYTSSLIEPFYAADFALTSWQIGMAQSAVPMGAIVGAVLAGWLADGLGRRRLLVWSFLCLAVVGLITGFAFNFYSLFFLRALNGLLAGTLYPLCAAYLIEMTPVDKLARQSAILMFVNCLAAPVGCLLAFLLSTLLSDAMLWRVLTAFHALPAFAAYRFAKTLPESRAWLIAEQQGRQHWAEIKALKALFNPTHRYMTCCLLGTWFLMDVAYYGINFFIPYLLQAMQSHSLSSGLATELHVFIINVSFALGALLSVFIIEKWGLIQLQKMGFIWASLSLLLLANYFYMGLNQGAIIILLFVLFNLALNAGPDVTTYLLSATSYPVEIRGSSHGVIAGFAKGGSVLGVLFLPKLQESWGVESVLLMLAMLLFFAYMLTVGLAKTMLKDHHLTEANLSYETN
jgi:MFS family permease